MALRSVGTFQVADPAAIDRLIDAHVPYPAPEPINGLHLIFPKPSLQ
jgi:hypothetical protein